SLTPRQLANRLDDRFRLLTGGSRTVLPRQQTLRAVVDWSWDLLGEPERALARRFSVFAGGATEEGARQVCGLGDDTLDVLTALVDKSLLVAVRDEASTRYRMLQTIRAYAAERLDEAGERTEVEAAHTALVLDLVETAEPLLRRPGQLPWVTRLRAESDDVTAALRRAVAAADASTAQRLAAAGTWFWMMRGLFAQATDQLAAACALDGPVPPAAAALCAAYRAMEAAGAADMETASARLAEAHRLAAGLPADRHPVLLLMGPVAAGFGHGDTAPLERLIADPAVDPWARAFAMLSCAQIAENDGDRDRQRADMRAAHDIFSTLGDRLGLGMTLSSLGDLESVAGAYDAAERAFDEAIALATELGNTDDLPQFETERGRLWVRRGDVADGRAELRRIAGRSGLHAELVTAVHLYLADAARRAGDLDDARTELALADLDAPTGLGRPQRRALIAAVGSAIAQAAEDRDGATALLAHAVEQAVESRDGPVLAAVAERAAAHARSGGDFAEAAALLGVGAAQRGASDLGDPEVRAVLAAVREALGADVGDAEIARVRALPRADGVALLQRYVRGGEVTPGPVPTGPDSPGPDSPGPGSPADSASATSRA
ncbi:MAG: hypothetical protein QOK35_1453, partial [Pseudonocardiales bacterium]|nr:hypothetical protein [Pseudonocardiales bacterium]